MSEVIAYHAVPSRGMIVHWMLEEVGEPYDLRVLDLDADEHKTPEYLAINPMGKVPALRHGDQVVTETAAICAYLAEAFPSAGLNVPVGSALRGEYLRWMFFAPVTAESAILWATLGDLTSAVDYEPFARIDAVTATLRSAVRGRRFIVGDHFSAADVMLGSTLMWGMRLMQVIPEHPELVAYWEGLEDRPAWQRAQAADEQIAAEQPAGSETAE
jgi:glutathione S-transferase